LKSISAIAITYNSSPDKANDVIARCKKTNPSLKIIAVPLSILDQTSVSALIPTVLNDLDVTTIDILVNNAAILDMAYVQPFPHVNQEKFTEQMLGNLFTPLRLIQDLLPHLPKRGGRVINISSIASKVANPDGVFVYGATKAGLDSLTRGLGAEYAAKTGATFNSVSVGAIKTGPTEKLIKLLPEEDVKKMFAAQTADPERFAEAEDVAFIVGKSPTSVPWVA
jgi:3-oxoacyl-[acyl-carrier protein] reductase